MILLKLCNSMIDINELFFELIRVSLGVSGCLSNTPTNEEWIALYDIAKKQSLVGICFAGVQRLQLQRQCLEEMQYLTWMGMAAKIQQRNEVVNRQCVDVQQMIEKEGFHTFIMKGQGNAALYQCGVESKEGRECKESDLSLLRQSGDIDIYLDGGFEKVNAFVQKTCPTKEINELEIHYHCLPETEVEIHYRAFIMRNSIKNARLQRFFGEAMRFDNKVDIPNGVGSINVPTIEFNLVHQMVHIYHHLFTEGIGMRQLMDYYFVVKHEIEVEKGLNVQEVKKVISDLGLDKFASALMWVIQHVFGLSMIGVPWTPNQRDGEFLLKEIMLSGNFGKQDERQKGLYDSKWNSFWMVNGKAFRLARFDHWMWFWGPVWRVYHFLWRKMKGFK